MLQNQSGVFYLLLGVNKSLKDKGGAELEGETKTDVIPSV